MSFRTPTQIQKFVDENQFRLDVPAQFYGDEPNSYRKDWDAAELRMTIGACWAYEQAAGNESIPLVYRGVNEWGKTKDGPGPFLCDRGYFPSTPRDLRIFEQAGIPFFGIETKHQLADFDVFGTSISYPVLSINFIKQLVMSDIPPTWCDRTDADGRVVAGRQRDPERWPFVIVGGQGFGAPEVLASIADCIFCGEAEDEVGNPGLGHVLERILTFKKLGVWGTERERCYERLAVEFGFLYFPRFIDVSYDYEERPTVAAFLAPDGIEAKPSKQVTGYTSKLEGMRVPVLKRFVKDLDSVEALDNPPLLYTEPGMGAGDIEVSRGCPAWCSFCALSWRQKPYRQRSVEYMVEHGKKLVENTGGMVVAPFGPDFPMHTEKKRLIKALLENVSDDVDGSSMRVDDFIADPSYILLQAYGGMDTVTLGVEGNSQRMRDLVGKGAADEDVKQAVARGIRAGINKFKLYMIASLPGEDTGDIYRILNLAKELADIRDGMGSSCRIQFSWTPMLIEGNTPFQWFSPTISNYALADVWEELRSIRIDFKLGGKSQRDKLLYFQLTQRASREIGLAMVEAVCDMGQGSWGGAPRGIYAVIQERLAVHGFLNGIADAYDERHKHDMFGWEFIDQGINVELMWVTYQQMVEFLENTDAETYDLNFDDDYHGNEWIERCNTKCYGRTCGVCDAQDLRIRRSYIQAEANEISTDLSDVKMIDQKTVAMKVRARVVKSEGKRFVMNDHWRYAVRRAAYRAGLPITKRTVKFSSDALRFKDWTSGADFVEFGLLEPKSKAELAALMEAMDAELGDAMTITDWRIHPAASAPLRSDVDLSLFDMEIDVDVEKAREAIARWEKADYIKMVFKMEARMEMGVQREVVNAKDFVDDLWLLQDGPRLRLRMLIRGRATPYLVYGALFGKVSDVESRKKPANRIEAFVENDTSTVDFFRGLCVDCGTQIPVNLLDVAYDTERCPRCKDEAQELVGA